MGQILALYEGQQPHFHVIKSLNLDIPSEDIIQPIPSTEIAGAVDFVLQYGFESESTVTTSSSLFDCDNRNCSDSVHIDNNSIGTKRPRFNDNGNNTSSNTTTNNTANTNIEIDSIKTAALTATNISTSTSTSITISTTIPTSTNNIVSTATNTNTTDKRNTAIYRPFARSSRSGGDLLRARQLLRQGANR